MSVFSDELGRLLSGYAGDGKSLLKMSGYSAVRMVLEAANTASGAEVKARMTAKPRETINYKILLKKYMAVIADAEGVTYIDYHSDTEPLTDAEKDALEKISNEVWQDREENFVTSGSCCNNELRNIDGKCISCGDPIRL